MRKHIYLYVKYLNYSLEFPFNFNLIHMFSQKKIIKALFSFQLFSTVGTIGSFLFYVCMPCASHKGLWNRWLTWQPHHSTETTIMTELYRNTCHYYNLPHPFICLPLSTSFSSFVAYSDCCTLPDSYIVNSLLMRSLFKIICFHSV